MKIGIITFHAAFNYGSMLQAWALQTYLESKGHEVQIVNYRSRLQRLTYHKPLDFHNVENSLSSCKRLLLYPSSIKPLNKKWHLFDDFLHHELHLTKEYHTVKELEQAQFDFDILICGSDQIWNTNAPDSGEAYYGNWFKGKKISYAASFGAEPQKQNIAFHRANINGFHAISVREKEAVDYLHNTFDIKSEVVCDPTMLLSGNDYSTILNEKPLVDHEYIFYYSPVHTNRRYFDIVYKISKEYNLPVVCDRAYYNNEIKGYKTFVKYPEIGPKEFLNLIKNANFVVGSSFHLIVFSILFQKHFFCIDGDRDRRTNNILSICDFCDRIVSLSRESINYSFSSDKKKRVSLLPEYVDDSYNFLNNELT